MNRLRAGWLVVLIALLMGAPLSSIAATPFRLDDLQKLVKLTPAGPTTLVQAIDRFASSRRRRSLVVERAQAAGDSPDFSARIREGLPPRPEP